ncbi:MAG: YihA family ribosome biogenesis GTP-binding protein [Marinilabiliales bacterium]|nr:MAG: YihA family ribosome biogenesis GTP-binding protein [Marinilabiliales bacterium]
MVIKSAEFVKSSAAAGQFPPPDIPEYAFTGRSNVGKSSLINMLTGHKRLAKTSSTPGKTKLVNHFLINDQWYLADLPGYGYARTSRSERKGFGRLIESYIRVRENLVSLFVLVDSRHEPQVSDLNFINSLGYNGVPFAIVFTKSDKLSPALLQRNVDVYLKRLEQEWETPPPWFCASVNDYRGREEILGYIENGNYNYAAIGN